MNIDKVNTAANFDLFPKVRTPLPEEYSKIYEKEYIENRTSGGFGNSVARKLEAWMHRRVSEGANCVDQEILELGAGSLNHIPWERGYSAYDVVEPFRGLLETSPNIDLLRSVYPSLCKVPLGNRYDRVISIAVLEHLLDLPMEIARSGLLLKERGNFCAGVPSEGGWLWNMAWKHGTGPGFTRRTGLDYGVLMRYEHVNTVDEIERCMRHFFAKVSITRFPFPSKSLSLYSYIQAAKPDAMRCKAFMKNRTV